MSKKMIKFLIICTSLLCLFFTYEKSFSASTAHNYSNQNLHTPSDNIKQNNIHIQSTTGLRGKVAVAPLDGNGEIVFYGENWTPEEKEKAIEALKKSSSSNSLNEKIINTGENKLHISGGKQ